MRPKRETVELTRIELEAVFWACMNYVPNPSRGVGWKKAAQARVTAKALLGLKRLRQGRLAALERTRTVL